jgi:hypothetical protein
MSLQSEVLTPPQTVKLLRKDSLEFYGSVRWVGFQTCKGYRVGVFYVAGVVLSNTAVLVLRLVNCGNQSLLIAGDSS